MNVKKVAGCAPGFEGMEEIGHERWKATITAPIGPMKAKFVLDITRSGLQEPERMVVTGRGNAPGTTIEASGDMKLVALTPESTRLDWVASVNVTGGIAKLGVSLFRGTVEKLTGQFFECLKKNISAAYGRW